MLKNYSYFYISWLVREICLATSFCKHLADHYFCFCLQENVCNFTCEWILRNARIFKCIIKRSKAFVGNKAKGQISKWSTPNFLKNEHFLSPNTWVCDSGDKKCLFFGKLGAVCFLVTPVLRFALLPYYQSLGMFHMSKYFLRTSQGQNKVFPIISEAQRCQPPCFPIPTTLSIFPFWEFLQLFQPLIEIG